MCGEAWPRNNQWKEGSWKSSRNERTSLSKNFHILMVLHFVQKSGQNPLEASCFVVYPTIYHGFGASFQWSAGFLPTKNPYSTIRRANGIPCYSLVCDPHDLSDHVNYLLKRYVIEISIAKKLGLNHSSRDFLQKWCKNSLPLQSDLVTLCFSIAWEILDVAPSEGCPPQVAMPPKFHSQEIDGPRGVFC